MSSPDPTHALHVCLYVLALECFLFFAVVAETRSQDPYAHGGVARAFEAIFLLQSLSAFCYVLSLQIAKSTLGEIFAGSSIVFITIMVAVAAPTAATVAVPEMRYRTWKAVITGLSAAVLFGSILIVGPVSQFLAPTGSHNLASAGVIFCANRPLDFLSADSWP